MVELRTGLALVAVPLLMSYVGCLLFQVLQPCVCASNCSCFYWQYVAAGVPVRLLEVILRVSRCWICTSLGVLPQFVSIVLDTVYPWVFVLQWLAVLFLQIFGTVPVLLR